MLQTVSRSLYSGRYIAFCCPPFNQFNQNNIQLYLIMPSWYDTILPCNTNVIKVSKIAIAKVYSKDIWIIIFYNFIIVFIVSLKHYSYDIIHWQCIHMLCILSFVLEHSQSHMFLSQHNGYVCVCGEGVCVYIYIYIYIYIIFFFFFFFSIQSLVYMHNVYMW